MIETEVKFLLENPESIRRRLQRAGAAAAGVVFETNYRYDDAYNRLEAAHHLLRLRRDTRSRLTFKRPTPEGGRQFKTHEELEIDVSDFHTTSRILEAIGFQRAQVYEKHRETYALGETEICLDRMPFGHFLEIEGAPAAIPPTAERLELDWQRRILTNYLHIFDAIRQAFDLPFNDVTFANFKTVTADPTAIIRRFESASAS
jgi:adenylate cyclase class 2